MHGWLQDFRFGLRALRRSPGSTAVAVVALGVAIGAAATLFAVVNGVLIRPLPFPEADRLVAIWHVHTADPDTWLRATAGNFTDWRRLARSFDRVAAASNRSFTLTSFEEPDTPLMREVSHGYFETLGVEPLLGRTFRPEDDRPGAEPVLILSHELWQQRFGGDPGVLGSTTELDGMPHEIVGVMPPGVDNPAFTTPVPPQLWFPYADAESGLDRRRPDRLVVARLAPGVRLEQAQEEMDGIAAALEEEYPEANRGVRARVAPLAELLVRNLRPAVWLLFGAVLFVLVVAAGNVANLLLTRTVGRQREIAVRRALGAGRRRVVRQLVAESLLLTLGAGGLGLLAAAWGAGSVGLLLPDGFQRQFDVTMDGNVALFTLAVSLLVGTVFGLVSGAHALRGGLEQALGVGASRATGGPASRRLRQLLVVGEVALSLMLLVAAGLMVRSFTRLDRLEPGFNPESLLTFRVSTRGPAYTEGAAREAFFREVLEGIRNLPGVEAAGVTHVAPFFPQFFTASVTVDAEPPPEPGREPQVALRRILPGYFEAMEIPLLQGRALRMDDDAEAPPVALVSRTLARELWPGRSPVGESLTSDGVSRRVVGVVGDVRSDGMPPVPGPLLYVPLVQDPQAPSVSYVVRARGEPMALLPDIQGQVRAVDRGMPVYLVQTMEEILAAMDWRSRFLSQLLSLFAFLALGLAATGIYAVLSYAVSQRSREIGIRMALGARRQDVLALVLRGGLGLAGAGVALGLLGALGLSRLLANQLYGVSATDPVTYGAVSLLLAALVLLASYVPARRATRVDPVETLGAE